MGFVNDRAHAVLAAMQAGVDVDCGGTFLNNASLVSVGMLRDSVRRTLKIRFQLGEFDPPQQQTQLTTTWTDHRSLAREAVIQGAVLLKNRENTLPLKKQIRLAVLGPLVNASSPLQGDY